MAERVQWKLRHIMGLVLLCAIFFAATRSFGTTFLAACLIGAPPIVLRLWARRKQRTSAWILAVVMTLVCFLSVLIRHFEAMYRQWVLMGRNGPLNLLSRITTDEVVRYLAAAMCTGAAYGAVRRYAERRARPLAGKAPASGPVPDAAHTEPC